MFRSPRLSRRETPTPHTPLVLGLYGTPSPVSRSNGYRFFTLWTGVVEVDEEKRGFVMGSITRSLVPSVTLNVDGPLLGTVTLPFTIVIRVVYNIQIKKN